MASQSFAEWYNRSPTRQRVAEEDSREENIGIPRPGEAPEPEPYDPETSFAARFAAQRPTQKSSGAHLVYREHASSGGSAAAIAAGLFTSQAEEPEPPPDEPTSKAYRGVRELVEAYEEADLLYDERETYGGSGGMSPTEWRTAWGRR